MFVHALRFAALVCMGCTAVPEVDRGPRPAAKQWERGLLVATRTGNCAHDGEAILCWDRRFASPWIERMNCSGCRDPLRIASDTTSEQLCAVMANGRVWCRQDDSPEISGVLDIATSDTHACARTAEHVSCWRHRQANYIPGRPERINVPGYAPARRTDPTIVIMTAVPAADVRDIAVTRESVCILDTAGGVTCHGFPAYPGTVLLSARVLAGVGPIVGIAVGADVCVLDSEGVVSCWPNAEFPPGPSAAPVRPGISDARLVAAGPFENCAASASGVVRCWSASATGKPRPCPDDFLLGAPELPDVVALSVSACEVCVRSSTGELQCSSATLAGPSPGAVRTRTIQWPAAEP